MAMQVEDQWYDGGSDALAFKWHFVFGAQPELTSAMTLFMNYMNKALAGGWRATTMPKPVLPKWVTSRLRYMERNTTQDSVT